MGIKTKTVKKRSNAKKGSTPHKRTKSAMPSSFTPKSKKKSIASPKKKKKNSKKMLLVVSSPKSKKKSVDQMSFKKKKKKKKSTWSNNECNACFVIKKKESGNDYNCQKK